LWKLDTGKTLTQNTYHIEKLTNIGHNSMDFRKHWEINSPLDPKTLVFKKIST
jgi:hypothetical protein